jgi:hypothetical protein
LDAIPPRSGFLADVTICRSGLHPGPVTAFSTPAQPASSKSRVASPGLYRWKRAALTLTWTFRTGFHGDSDRRLNPITSIVPPGFVTRSASRRTFAGSCQ